MTPERTHWGDDPSQFFDLYRAEGESRGTAVMIHGGFWRSRVDLSSAANLAAAFAAKGMTTASLEYRRTGTAGGGWPGTFDDIRTGFRAVLQHLGDNRSPTIVGHSAGGHLALLLATYEPRIAGVVALGAAAHLELGHRQNIGNGAVQEFLNASPKERPDLYDAADPARRASAVRRILVHGMNDEVVPLPIARAFVEARRDDEGSAQLVELAGVGHMELIDPQSLAWPAVLASLEGFF